MASTSEGSIRRRPAAVVAVLSAAIAALLCLASGANAAELIYWNNYDSDSLAFSNADGSGGGSLNLSGVALDQPEGMAYDSVTNRIFVASNLGGPENTGQIIFVNLDGSGAGVLGTPGTTAVNPEGLAIDPATRIAYWINTKVPETIGWAKLDGSGGGLLNTAGAKLEGAYRLAIDPVAGRVYWGNTPLGAVGISYANFNNTGGGNLPLTGATPPQDVSGLAVVPALGRIYWDDEASVSFASLAGGGGGDLNLTGAVFDEPYGLSVDPVTNKILWANYGHKTGEGFGALSFGSLGGGGGPLNITTAPIDGPQDPLLLKSPSAIAAPLVTRSVASRSALSCSTGGWAADLPGSFVYQTPRTFAYQWTRNGTPIPATATTLTAATPGKYACMVTASNQAGSAAQASAPLTIKSAKAKLTVKKKASALPGKLATFPIKVVNQGDLKSKNARVCVKVPKKAKAALKTPKCKSLGKLNGLAKRSAKVKVKVLPTASAGTYKVTFNVKGIAAKPVKAKVIVK
ncbi:MAG: hypothetical protein QOE56_530 [Solirubrobacterales bacterium]|jgi:hypothetical protein|nr:hypothetical protein [Solirubrobacterales bacterium]